MNQRTPEKKQVVTVLGNPAVAPLAKQEVDSVVDALEAQGAIVEHVEWLSPEEACDIYFAVLPIEEAREVMWQLLEHAPFDAVVQHTAGRKKKLIISDMDSTMIKQECIDELADFAGIKAHIAAITERAMNGELDFKDALRERVGLLKGLEEAVLEEAYSTRIVLMDGAKELITTMKTNGASAILVSGGFTYFTSRVREALGFDVDEANVLGIADGALDGKVKEPILDKTSKLNALKYHAEEQDIPLWATLAIGDGANDLDMLCYSANAGGLGVAYHAKPIVQHAALESGGAVLRHVNLRGVLFAQGYKAAEIVS